MKTSRYFVSCMLERKLIRGVFFVSYDKAFDYARRNTENEGLTSVIVYNDPETETWVTKIKLSPN